MMLLEDFRYKQKVFQDDGLDYSMLRIISTDGSSAMILYRCMRWFHDVGLKPLAYLVQVLNKLLNQCVIGTGASFGRGFVIMHPNGLIMNSRVTGGENVVLESGVVIGSEKGQTPILGNNVFVGAGAKIIGSVTLGDGSKVGANAVVVKDVAAHTTVVGIPAKPVGQRSEA